VTTCAYSRDRQRAVLDLIGASERPLSAKDICDALDFMPSQVSCIIGDLRKGRKIRLAGMGPAGSGRPPRLYDTQVELGDADTVPTTLAKPTPAYEQVAAWVREQPREARLSVQGVASGSGFTFDYVTKIMRRLLAGGSVRVVDYVRSARGKPAPIYDQQLDLASAPEPLPRSRAEWKAANPVRAAVYRERDVERKRLARAESKAAEPAVRPAFDPKTAINWKRAA
jgi:hypothetical protein